MTSHVFGLVFAGEKANLQKRSDVQNGPASLVVTDYSLLNNETILRLRQVRKVHLCFFSHRAFMEIAAVK